MIQKWGQSTQIHTKNTWSLRPYASRNQALREWHSNMQKVESCCRSCGVVSWWNVPPEEWDWSGARWLHVNAAWVVDGACTTAAGEGTWQTAISIQGLKEKHRKHFIIIITWQLQLIKSASKASQEISYELNTQRHETEEERNIEQVVTTYGKYNDEGMTKNVYEIVIMFERNESHNR